MKKVILADSESTYIKVKDLEDRHTIVARCIGDKKIKGVIITADANNCYGIYSTEGNLISLEVYNDIQSLIKSNSNSYTFEVID